MTGQEVAKLSDSAKAFLSASASEVGENSFSPYPVLRIQQDHGGDVPHGNFYISDTEYQSPEVLFRPLVSVHKIMRWLDDGGTFSMAGETIYFHSWQSKVSRVDTLGGVDCGRKFGKNTEGLTAEELDSNKKKGTVYLDVYGQVTFPDSNEEPVTAVLRLTGGKMVRFQEATDPKVCGGNMRSRNFKLSTVSPKDDPLLSLAERKKAKGNHVNIIVEPQMNELLPIEPVAEIGGEILTWISSHNEAIINTHINKREEGQFQNEEDSFIEAEFEEVQG